jgi:hypothetical protein
VRGWSLSRSDRGYPTHETRGHAVWSRPEHSVCAGISLHPLSRRVNPSSRRSVSSFVWDRATSHDAPSASAAMSHRSRSRTIAVLEVMPFEGIIFSQTCSLRHRGCMLRPVGAVARSGGPVSCRVSPRPHFCLLHSSIIRRGMPSLRWDFIKAKPPRRLFLRLPPTEAGRGR